MRRRRLARQVGDAAGDGRHAVALAQSGDSARADDGGVRLQEDRADLARLDEGDRLVRRAGAGVERLAVDHRRPSRAHAEPDDRLEQLAGLADPFDEGAGWERVVRNARRRLDPRHGEAPGYAQGAGQRRGPALRGGYPAAVPGPPGRIEPYPVRLGEPGRQAVRADDRRPGRVRRGVEGGDGVDFDRRHVQAREAEGERVRADSAAEIHDPPRARGEEALRVQGAHAQPRGLFVAGGGEEHRACALAEFGRGPGSQPRQSERGGRSIRVEPLRAQPRRESESLFAAVPGKRVDDGPPAGADQPARDGELPRLGVEARGIDGVHAPSLTRLAVRHALSVELALEPCEC